MEDVTFSEYLNFTGGKFKFSTYLGEWFGTFCWPCKGIKVKTPSEIKPPLPFENCMYALNWLSEPVLITCAEVTLFSWAWLLFSKLVAIWRESTWTLWVFLHNGGVVRSVCAYSGSCHKVLFLTRNQRYTYRVLQTIQMKHILLCVWAERAILGSAKTSLKFKYEI